ncbi:hypothetical protein SAMN02745248_01599 [Hathewaya proteolytica DSM 3090]|uniref:ABC-2 family transporter protein n=1 Tax=Hathewaya proteolytica DSM 3090 TaxID=1121331 RepID=A0A1M6P5X5_9CLOT|nr:hypothetical protein [Hathewaya proteolytica]SHK03293.1 hypothetical protein SAMN02745248_01599 [Hathewaya proteolytica DSM 3090]
MDPQKDKKDIEVPKIDFNQIEDIVNNNIRTKNSFIMYLRRSLKELGLKNIFHDKTELIAIGMVVSLILIFYMKKLANIDANELYGFVFVGAPIVYLGAVTFSFYNSKERGTFNIEMTCKYNLYQVIALKMFCFSVITIVINTSSILIIGSIFKTVNVIRMIIISISGLFIFSTVFLYSLVGVRIISAKYVVIVAWLSINVILNRLNCRLYTIFIMNTPIYIHLFVSVICGFLYMKNLNRLINYRRKMGEI